jgi:hypothetical protein
MDLIGNERNKALWGYLFRVVPILSTAFFEQRVRAFIHRIATSIESKNVYTFRFFFQNSAEQEKIYSILNFVVSRKISRPTIKLRKL